MNCSFFFVSFVSFVAFVAFVSFVVVRGSLPLIPPLVRGPEATR